MSNPTIATATATSEIAGHRVSMTVWEDGRWSYQATHPRLGTVEVASGTEDDLGDALLGYDDRDQIKVLTLWGNARNELPSAVGPCGCWACDKWSDCDYCGECSK